MPNDRTVGIFCILFKQLNHTDTAEGFKLSRDVDGQLIGVFLCPFV